MKPHRASCILFKIQAAKSAEEFLNIKNVGILNPHLGQLGLSLLSLNLANFDQLHDFFMNFYGRILLLHLVMVKPKPSGNTSECKKAGI